MIAVTSVILFHIWPDLLPGGFLGVDVFLVISGYLISKIIADKLVQKRFSFSDFYLRRVRRIIPAQLLVTAATLIGFSFVLAPDELSDLGQSGFYASFSLANVYYWLESGYFGAVHGVTPLLHMWSLGVEEQFYLVWPALLGLAWLARGRLAILLLLVLAFAGSFAAALVLYDSNGAAVFYLFPFRAFEFVLGGALAVRAVPALPKSIAPGIAGLAIIALLASMIFVDESWRHPGWITLVPCIATALLIHAMTTGSIVRTALASPPSRHIGLLSYSLYLVHWPIVVAARLLVGEDMSPVTGVLLIVLIYVVAAGLHYGWERPMRYGFSGSRSPSAAGLWVILAVFLATSFWSVHLWTSNAAREAPDIAVGDLTEWAEARSADQALGLCPAQIHDASDLEGCRTDILVIGDSHASQTTASLRYFAALHEREWQISVWTMPGCTVLFDVVKRYFRRDGESREEACSQQQQAWRRAIENTDIGVVAVISRWDWLTEPPVFLSDRIQRAALVRDMSDEPSPELSRELFAEALPHTVNTMLDEDVGVIIFGQVPITLQATLRCGNRVAETGNANEECDLVDAEPVLARFAYADRLLESVSVDERVRLIQPSEHLCAEGGACIIAEPDTGVILYRDGTHLSLAGNQFLATQYDPALVAFIESHLNRPPESAE